MGRLPRTAYSPGKNENGVYLHIYNNCNSQDELFGEMERSQFLKITFTTLQLYSIDCLSAVIMPSWYHLILYVPKDSLSCEDITAKLISENKYDAAQLEEKYCRRRAEISNNLSHFMNELQRNFTVWFNKTRSFRRRGTIWARRYKCSKLLDSNALLYCLKYNELSPVRAKLVETPDSYAHSTYGLHYKYNSESVEKHLSTLIQKENIHNYLKTSFNKLSEDLKPLLLTSRLWTDAVALGSKDSLKKYALTLWGPERASIKKFGKVILNKNCELFSLRQLIVNV